MNQDDFKNLVAEALDALPKFFQDRLENVDVVVEDWPDAATLHRAGVQHRTQLLGFYHGVPQTKRTRHYGLVLPDKITIYRRPIEMCCRTMEDIQAKVYSVLKHEIAHHFGISDARLRELDAY